MYLTKEKIIDKLNCTPNRSVTLLRKYKKKFTEERGAKLLDNKTLPTQFFIEKYSKEFGIGVTELCTLFDYDLKVYKQVLNEVSKKEEVK